MERSALYDQEGTVRLGTSIAALLRPGDAVLLQGGLGAGKTTLARALIRAACESPALEVPSPSYTLVQSYLAPRFTLHHFDLWRLDGAAALAELGWDEATEDVVLVEWPDRLDMLRPPDALMVTIDVADQDTRRITLEGWQARTMGATNSAGR